MSQQDNYSEGYALLLLNSRKQIVHPMLQAGLSLARLFPVLLRLRIVYYCRVTEDGFCRLRALDTGKFAQSVAVRKLSHAHVK